MSKSKLVKELIELAKNYGLKNYGAIYLHPMENTKSSIIFNELSYSFQPKSWQAIEANSTWSERSKKIHPNSISKGVYEMQSSNSSDALAMNIFCFPEFIQSEKAKNLFGIDSFSPFQLGFKAHVKRSGLRETSEVDIYINESIICECKLTEDDFKSMAKNKVELYSNFSVVFHANKLKQNQNSYSNYQLIRNILAAYQYNCRFVLICDNRRPELVESFNKTIECIKDEFMDLKTKSKIIYWQEIAKVCGIELQQFLKVKYGIF